MSNLYLAIESSTKMCSTALFKNEELVDLIEEGGTYSHAEKLAPFVDQLLKKNAIQVSDLSAIAVSGGPGSYTGLRIGLSLAKGICFSSSKPLISIPSLKGIAQCAIDRINDPNALYVPMIDARRMEVYCMTFDAQLNEVNSLSAKVISENSFAEALAKNTLIFIGDGAAKCKQVISDPNALFPEENFITASSWGKLIHQKFRQKTFEDLAYYEPNYLKEFKAIKSKPLL